MLGSKHVMAEHKIRVIGQTKTGQVCHLSEQKHVWSVMLLCNYQSSTTRNELMSAQTALKTDQSKCALFRHTTNHAASLILCSVMVNFFAAISLVILASMSLTDEVCCRTSNNYVLTLPSILVCTFIDGLSAMFSTPDRPISRHGRPFPPPLRVTGGQNPIPPPPHLPLCQRRLHRYVPPQFNAREVGIKWKSSPA